MVQPAITLATSGDPLLDLWCLNEAINKEGPKGAWMIAQRIVVIARQKARKKTGAMASSINARKVPEGAALSFGGNGVYYHLFQEYGTQRMSGPGYHGKLPGKGGYSDDYAYPFMRPAIDQVVNSGLGISLMKDVVHKGYTKRALGSGGFASLARQIMFGGIATSGNPMKNLKTLRGSSISATGPIKVSDSAVKDIWGV